ncbi:spindle and kinetochore-associated protein 2 isoform X3 [Suricata suricatta]|uniref:spindle and kinetochore-associated protein 2 isoform X3 n=1 Tax=Suricata suricatta TaxID=37032 RepID=UPI001155D224|nr:spindle and kinetochore-associated protein 2 isoform X3 [Suricata suricatta]
MAANRGNLIATRMFYIHKIGIWALASCFLKNPVTLLKELSAIKSRYQTLYARFKPIAVEQKESKNRICATVNKTMTMIQELQKQTDVELSPLTKEEKTAAEQLKSFVSDL